MKRRKALSRSDLLFFLRAHRQRKLGSEIKRIRVAREVPVASGVAPAEHRAESGFVLVRKGSQAFGLGHPARLDFNGDNGAVHIRDEGKGTGNRDRATGRKANPVTAVLGPRQAGKSTLVRHSLVNQIKTLILDLDLPSDLRRFICLPASRHLPSLLSCPMRAY